MYIFMSYFQTRISLLIQLLRAHYDTMEKRFIDASKQLRELSEQSHEEKTLHLKLASQIKEIDILSSEKEALVQELKTSTEKCVKLEEQLGSSTSKSTEMSARKRVAILEIAELNERQKAEHLKRENEKLKITAKSASERIKELEVNVDKLSK